MALFILCIDCAEAKSQNALESILRVAEIGEIHTLDPSAISNREERVLYRQVHETLLKRDPGSGKLVASAAKDYRISNDGKTYTFDLRDDLFWSNGEKITEKDFAFGLKRLLEPPSRTEFALHLSAVKGAQELLQGAFVSSDDLGIQTKRGQLILTLSYPDPFLIHWLSFPQTAPVHEKSLNVDKKWIFSGPFSLDTRSPNLYILEKNLHHRNARELTIDRVYFYLFSTIEDAISAFKKGDVDIVGSQTYPIPREYLTMYGGTTNIQFQPDIKTYFLRLNLQHPLMSQQDFRRVLATGIDREDIVEKVSFEGEKQAYSILPEELGSYKVPHAYYYGLHGARELLKKMGYCSINPTSKSREQEEIHVCIPLPKMTLLYPEGYEYRKIALAVTAFFKRQLGLDIFPRAASPKKFLEMVSKGSYMIALDEIAASSDFPFGMLESFRSKKSSAGAFESSEYDQLLNQAQAAFTLDDAKNIYHKAESFLLNEMVAIPLLRDASGILVSPRVKGYPLSPWDICDYASLSVSPIEKNRVQSAS